MKHTRASLTASQSWVNPALQARSPQQARPASPHTSATGISASGVVAKEELRHFCLIGQVANKFLLVRCADRMCDS